MPPAKTPVKPSARAAGKTPPGGKPPTDGRGKPVDGGRGRFFRRFAANRPATAGRRTESMGSFVREVRNELRKVEWPTREEATKLTAAVVALSAIVGVFLGGVDYIFQELFKFLISATGGGV